MFAAKFKNKVFTLLLATGLTLGASMPAQADDIDIYYGAPPAAGGEPLVMFSLDYRSNLGSTVCNGGECQFLVDEGYLPAQASYTFYEMMRAVLKKVMDPLQGVRIGLMLNHDNANTKIVVPRATGSSTGADPFGFELFDTTADFVTAGVQPGDKIENITDGTSAFVLTVSADFITHTQLKQGNNPGSWSNGDQYLVTFITEDPSLPPGCAGPAAALTPTCSNGGYIAMGFELFELGDGNGAKANFHQFLADIPLPGGNTSHSYQGKELFFELFRYLTGQGIYNGHVGYRDYRGEPVADPLLNLDVNFPLISWDTGAEKPGNSGLYRSPLGTNADCTDLFSVNVMFQVSQQEDASDAAIGDLVINGGTGSPRDTFPDMLEYLNDVDLADGVIGNAPNILGNQNLTSFFLVPENNVSNKTIAYAQAGGTVQPLPLSDDPEELVNTLSDIFNQILSVSTTFVAASIPVNVFNRAQIVDNVYLALFQPDAQGRPYWTGNVKKLKLNGLHDGSGNVFLADALDQPAVAADGRIRFDVLTYWTNPNALPPPDLDEGEIAGRDGRAVSRGGAGQNIPGMINGIIGTFNGVGSRQVLYQMGGVLQPMDLTIGVINDLTPYFNLSVPAVDMVTEVSWMVLYARGYDIDDLDNDGILVEARPWIMADPLHSRPLPMNYGAWGSYDETNPAIFLAVASNDGYLHFIRNTTSAGGESGEEVWAYMPKESLDVLAELRTNAATLSHPYTVDGSPVAYMLDVDGDGTIETIDGDKAYVFVGMRRGGKELHALDVSDPENPKFLWQISNADADFSELGMTFSTPRVGKLQVGFDNKPVLIFAGGYDPNKDLRPAVGSDDAQGNALYVVDIETGALIWKAVGQGTVAADTFVHAGMVDSFPSPIALADLDGDGFTDRVVVGDSGGKLWRADFAGNMPSNWKMTLLANLGRHSSVGGTKVEDRRFFHRPDIVPSRDGIGAFDAILIGSGDRADPLGAGGLTDDFLYMIKDRNIAVGGGVDSLLDHVDLADVSDNCLQAGTCALNLSNGWKLGLQDDGEKSLATPLTIGGTVFITTYAPPIGVKANKCSPSEGNGFLYAVDLQNAFAVKNYDATDDGLDGSGVSSTDSDRRTLLASEGIPAEVVSLPPDKILRPDLTTESATSSSRWRTFWYNAEDTDL